MSRLALFACVFAGSQPVLAAENIDPAVCAGLAPASFPDALKKLTDVGGLRSKLEKAGLKFTFTYYGDALGNPVGGERQGTGYSGRFGTIIDGDLEKLAGWNGASFHASIHEIHGYGLSANNLGNLMLVSSVEAPDSLRLFNLWIEQKLTDDIALRVGQYTAAQEFLVSKDANVFVNATFGWPVLPAQDLPSGGPAFPEGALGARLRYKPNDRIVFRAAVFDGNPAGPGNGNPVTRDPYGADFRLGDPAFVIAEAVYFYNQEHPDSPQNNLQQENLQQEGDRPRTLSSQSAGQDLPGTVKFGGWYHAGLFADPRFNAQGGLLATGGQPQQHRGDFAVYGVLEQMIGRVDTEHDRGVSAFLRASASPSDRNPIDLYVDAGLTLKGPFESRPNDILGLGAAYGRVSPEAAAHDRDLDAFLGKPAPIRDFEATIELTYQLQLASNWTLQPDFQYIVHPGGNIANPLDPNGVSPIRNAAVMGLRTILKF